MQQLNDIAIALRNGGPSVAATPRDLLRWANASRRGRHVVSSIRRDLRLAGLRTQPDFEYAFIDGPILFELEPQAAAAGVAPPAVEPVEPQTLSGGAGANSTYRIGMLESANASPVSVAPQATLAQAVTTMLYHDFSQLAVMQGERDLKGAISWRSIGKKLALGQPCAVVRDCMEPATTIGTDDSLFGVLPTIVEKEFVFVTDSSRRIVGIVTTTDLSLQFRLLAEPFLLLGTIENHLRHLSDRKFTADELRTARDPQDTEGDIDDLADLTFGEHLRLLEKPERWSALGLKIDRGIFIRYLDDVRKIRNGVMHFDPDGVDPAELLQLRNFANLLASLRSKQVDATE